MPLRKRLNLGCGQSVLAGNDRGAALRRAVRRLDVFVFRARYNLDRLRRIVHFDADQHGCVLVFAEELFEEQSRPRSVMITSLPGLGKRSWRGEAK